MGNRVGLAIDSFWYDDTPRMNLVSQYDPHYGFERQRKERVMVATPEEMESAKLKKKHQNYCAHFLLDYLVCKKKYAPFHKYKCHHQHHSYTTCEYEDWIIRMKDFERERRFIERKRRREAAAA